MNLSVGSSTISNTARYASGWHDSESQLPISARIKSISRSRRAKALPARPRFFTAILEIGRDVPRAILALCFLQIMIADLAHATTFHAPVAAYELWGAEHALERTSFTELVCRDMQRASVEALAGTSPLSPEDPEFAVWGRCSPHRLIDGQPISWEAKCEISAENVWTCDKYEVLFARVAAVPVRFTVKPPPFVVRDTVKEIALDEGWRALKFLLSTETLLDPDEGDWDEFGAFVCRNNRPCHECRAGYEQGDVFVECDMQSFRVRSTERGKFESIPVFPQ